MRFKVGEQPVPGYRLDAFLGAGSYGEVWKVIGPGGVPCAMKFISLDSKSGLKEFRSIGLVKKLQHPNLCPVNAIWLRDDEGNVLSDTDQNSMTIRLLGPKELIIAMGLGRKTLAQRLEETRGRGIPPHELLRYMVDAARGIDYLNSPEHDLGSGPSSVIHCDIKPANLLIVGGGVQVCDYGVVRALGPDIVRKTFAAGTPAYAPPELINNEPCAQTDQYSLAITYYELRTGQLPFEETKAIVANLTGQLDLSLVANNDEREVLRQALALQPDRRFATCEEFIDTLRVASGITLGRPPSGVHQQPAARPLPGPGSGSGSAPFQQSGSDLQSWPQATPFADRPTPRITPTPLLPGSAEHQPLPRSTPPEPPRRSPTPDGGTLHLDAPQDVVVNLVSGPVAAPRGTPTPEPPIPKGSGVFIDDEERQSRGAGAFLPIAIGLVLCLGLVAAGAYIILKDDTRTTPTTEPTRTVPTAGPDPHGGGSSDPSVELAPPPRPVPPSGGGSQDPTPQKDYSKELRAARTHFALAEMDEAEVQKGLDELAKIPDPDPAKPDSARTTAAKLKDWWKKAWAARDLMPIELRAAFPLPTTNDLDPADLDSVKEYRADKLAKAIVKVIPRLEVEANWKDLASACEEADQTPAVLACLAECWAEGPEAARTGKTYAAVVLTAPLNGYPQYAAMRLKQAQGAKAVEGVAALLKEVEGELPPWVNARRGEVLVKAFSEAARTAPNAEAYRLLTVAERKASANDRFDIRYRRLMAGWDNGAMKDSARAELKKLAQALKADAVRFEKLAPSERYKFWIAFAATLRDAADGEERDRAFIEALTVAKGVTDLKATDLRKQVLDPILADGFVKLPKGSDAEKKAGAFFREAGLSVRRNRAEWEEDGLDAMAYAGGLFNRAVGLTNQPEDIAWKGISLAESKAPALAEVAKAAEALGEPKRTDAPVVKVFRGVAGHLQATHMTSEKATKLAAHDQFLGALESLARTKGATDERPPLMRWATANAAWLVKAGYADYPLPVELPKPSERAADAPEAETYYWLATVERQRAAGTRGVADESLTRAVELYKKAWDAAGRPGGQRWAKPAASDLGDARVAEGERLWNLGDTRTAALSFVALGELTGPTSPVSATRKAWFEAHSLFRGPRPIFAEFDAIIERAVANAPAADRDAVVRLYLLRSAALATNVPGLVYPPELSGTDKANLARRADRAVAAAQNAVDNAAGLPAQLLAEARGSLGKAHVFDGRVRKLDDAKAAIERFGKAQTVLAEAILSDPLHEHAYIWKYSWGYCVLEKLDADKDYKNVPQLGLGFSLMLDAKADLFGARPGTDRASAVPTVEGTLKNWASTVDELPDDAGKDLVKLRELLDRAGAAANSGKDHTLTAADKELLDKVTKLAQKKDTPAAMAKALERIVGRLKAPG